jgi:hypothetical protein
VKLDPVIFSAAARASLAVTDDWVAEYRGLVIGALDSPLSLLAVEGLIDSPAVRTADRAILNRHGDVSGRDFVGSRTVTLTIEVNGRDAREFAGAMDALALAFAPSRAVAPFVFRFPGIAGGGVRFVAAKVRRRSAPVDVAFSQYLANVTVELYCASPLILDTTKLSDTAGLPDPDAPGGGITFPLTLPIQFGSPPDPGTIRVVNAGSFECYPRFRIYGPVFDPQIVNLASGEQITFRYALLGDEWLDVDTYSHEVLLNGVAPRFLLAGTANTWPVCQPGTTEFGFRGFRVASGPEGDGAELVAEWASAWV